MKPKILLAGNGVIGSGVANTIKNTNKYEIIIYDKNLENSKMESQLENVEYIISCLPDNCASEEFWFNDIIIKHIRDKNCFCLEMATLSYEYVLRLTSHIQRIGGKFVESPLTGSKRGAETGTLSLFIYSDYYDDIEVFLKIYSSKIYRFQSAGEPTKFKLLYNLWGAAYLYMVGEFLPIIENEFVNKDLVESILSNDGWMASVCKSKLPDILSRKFDDVSFKYKYMLKDVNYSLECLGKYELLISKQIIKRYNEFHSLQNENKDFSVIGLVDL